MRLILIYPGKPARVIPVVRGYYNLCMRILLVEDERRVASVVGRALRENSYNVDWADTGEKAIEMATQVPYDSILLDIRLPGLSGIEVCRELRGAKVDTPILMLTARGLVEQRVEGLDAGADDYLSKPFAIDELLARVRALIRRRAGDGRVLRYGDLELDRHRRRVTNAGKIISLTAKEFALLELLLSRAPDIVSRSEIMEQVWDVQFDTETNLVEVYINRLRQKITGPGNSKFIHTVHGAGYCLKAE